jgi:glycosyltransferase involved in cell wall biosynthesis
LAGRSSEYRSVVISVLILTLNEAENLERCLQSVAWSDDIVVLDSGSVDRTQEIAKRYGVRLMQRPFTSERDQRTHAIREIEFKYPWVYNPDADEVTTQDLRDEMLGVVSDPSRTEVAYRVRFKTMFMGRWLRHSSLYPTWVVRLFRPERLDFERDVNLEYRVKGREGRLSSHFLHYTFNNGFQAWFAKHNRYSSGEAVETMRELAAYPLNWAGLFDRRDPVRRRRAMKLVSLRLPMRPTLRFLYMYFLRLGFLDGFPGLTYCRLLAIYEYMIVLKVREIEMRSRDPSAGL